MPCGGLLCLSGFLWLACDSSCVQVSSGFPFGSVSKRKNVKLKCFLYAFNHGIISLQCCLCNDNILGPCVTVRKAVFGGGVDGNQTVKGHVRSAVLSMKERT